MQIRTAQKGAPRVSARASETFFTGTSSGLKAVEEVIPSLSQSDVPILLLAEAGSGKQTLAQRIHDGSRRRNLAFRVVRCADLDAESLNQRDQRDQNVLGGEGTVYFEEIAQLGAEAQLALLGVLARSEDTGSDTFRVRLIFGSARNLEAESRSGLFAEELYSRISGVSLRLPPLRHRKPDILMFMDFFLAQFAREFGRPIPLLSERTQQLFYDHDWPGNVTELADAARAIVVLGDEALAMGGLRAMLIKSDRDHAGQPLSLKDATRAASLEAEKDLIMKALNRTRWNRRRAAQELKISYKAFLYKLKLIGVSQSKAS